MSVISDSITRGVTGVRGYEGVQGGQWGAMGCEGARNVNHLVKLSPPNKFWSYNQLCMCTCVYGCVKNVSVKLQP